MRMLVSVLVTISLLLCCAGSSGECHDISSMEMNAMKVSSSDDDSGLSQSWYLDSIGCKDMWAALDNRDMLPGEGVVIAVIDTGLAAGTTALADARWCNEAELNGEEGVDDDGNGYIDDIYGLNLANSYYAMSDNNGHGTEVSGVIGMQPDDGGGVGIAYGARIMPIKVSTDTNYDEDDIIEALEYAVNMGADIINMSFATYRNSEKLENAVRKASESCVMIAAAGNEKYVTEGSVTEAELKAGGYGYGDAYPAAWDCCIGVMSYGQGDELASFSNWDQNSNPRKYDIIAPGDHIYTVTRANRYVSVSGTSYSTSIVAASVAVLKSIVGEDISADELRELFLYMMNDKVSFTYADVSYEFPKLSFSGMIEYLADHNDNNGEKDSGNGDGNMDDESEGNGNGDVSENDDTHSDDGIGGVTGGGSGNGGAAYDDNGSGKGMSDAGNRDDWNIDDNAGKSGIDNTDSDSEKSGIGNQDSNSGQTDLGNTDAVTEKALETQPIIEAPNEASVREQESGTNGSKNNNISKPQLGKVTQNKKAVTIKIKNYTKQGPFKVKLSQTVKKKGKKSVKTCSFSVKKNKLVISKKKLKKKGFRKGKVKLSLTYRIAGNTSTSKKIIKLKI